MDTLLEKVAFFSVIVHCGRKYYRRQRDNVYIDSVCICLLADLLRGMNPDRFVRSPPSSGSSLTFPSSSSLQSYEVPLTWNFFFISLSFFSLSFCSFFSRSCLSFCSFFSFSSRCFSFFFSSFSSGPSAAAFSFLSFLQRGERTGKTFWFCVCVKGSRGSTFTF